MVIMTAITNAYLHSTASSLDFANAITRLMKGSLEDLIQRAGKPLVSVTHQVTTTQLYNNQGNLVGHSVVVSFLAMVE